MKLYIYNENTNEIVAICNGENNDECEAKAEALNYDKDIFAWSYTKGLYLWETNETIEK